tara:strand:+ start:310 stop:849 length:540 start_codon:yes stop_codon:yes gene_type:complete
MMTKITIIPILLSFVVLILSACAEAEMDDDLAANYSSKANVLEGTWKGKCYQENNGQYAQGVAIYAGETARLESQAYSDAQCTNPTASDINLRTNGTFTLEEGGTIEGKKLTKINHSLTVTHSEGQLASFYPIGFSFNSATEYFIDGNRMYSTDAYTNIFTDGSYNHATQIDEEYAIRQ